MNLYAVWFRRIVYLGVLANLTLAVPALFVPDQILGQFRLPATADAMWPRFAALLLILLSLFYIPAAIDPFRYRMAAWLTVWSRVAGVIFFFFFFPVYFAFGLLDLVFAIPEGILLLLAYQSESEISAGVTRPAENGDDKRVRKRHMRRRVLRAVAILAVIAIPVLWTGWYHLFRVKPVSYINIDEYYKYGSIGAEEQTGIPYYVWLVLPRVFPEHLRDPDRKKQIAGGYESLGILWEEAQASEPGRPGRDGHETPIGFSVKTIGFPRIAINCAVCHSGSYRMSEDAKINTVMGMPAQKFDAQRYLQFLADCGSDPRFNADTLLQEISYHIKLSPVEKFFYRHIIIPQTRKGLMSLKEENSWWLVRPRSGPGVIEPFNGVKFGHNLLNLPVDDTIGNADMMPLWNVTRGNGRAFHWDGLNTSLTEVVRSSALGDGATQKTIPLADLDRLQSYITNELKPPRFPTPIAKERSERGKRIYEGKEENQGQEESCASCHAPQGKRFRQVIPNSKKNLDTDGYRLEMWTKDAADAYNNHVRNPSWRFKAFRDMDGYVAVPLDGLWLRAPYLHNGSVPSLRDLLNPPERRPKVFWRGYDVYDFKNIGFTSTGRKAEEIGVRFDTSRPGNGNGGHLYGTKLNPDQKEALLTYLKSL